MTRTGRSLAALCAVALFGLVVAVPQLVAAQSGDGSPDVLRVEWVDARSDVWSMGVVSSGGPPEVRFDGEVVPSEVRAPVPADVVIVIDNARQLGNGTVQLAKAAAASVAAEVLADGGRVGVVSTGGKGASQELALSSDPAAVESAIAAVQPGGDAATWSAFGRAANLLGGAGRPERVVALLSAPNSFTGTRAAATTKLRAAGTQVDAVVLPRGGIDPTGLGSMVANVGGSVRTIASDEEFVDAAAAVSTQLGQGVVVDFAAPVSEGSAELEVVAGNLTSEVEVSAGLVEVGASSLVRSGADVGLVQRLLSSALVQWLAVLLVAIAAIGLIWALLSMVLPDSDSLANRLSVYEEGGEEEEAEDGGHGVTTVPLLQRAVALTGEVAQRQGLLERVELTLERASLPLRAAEAMFFVGVFAVVGGLMGLVLTRNPLVALATAVLAVLVPKALVDNRVRSRQKKFVAQLPDMLSLLAGTLRAGYSITQGFEAVSREIEDPMGRELRRVVTEHRLGRTLEDALDATAERMDSDDFRWTVMAIKIQREVGGNLAELLLTVADTMVQRERLRRDVASLTAEGRISAMILGLLPPGLGVVMFTMNREYIELLFTPGMGYVMVGAALIAMAVGFAWMKKIITIEV